MIKVEFPLDQPFVESRIESKGLFSPSVQRAIGQAVLSHGDHSAAGNRPFLEGHLWPVVNVFLQATDELPEDEREDALVAAILHDTLEDDPNITSVQLSKSFSPRAIRWVRDLTRQAGYDHASNEEKLQLAREYMKELRNADKAPRLIKLADRLVNQYLMVESAQAMLLALKRYVVETEELFVPLATRTSGKFFKAIQNQLKVMKEVDKNNA